VIEDIAEQIETGTLKPGDRLPSAADLCRRYEVSTAVVGRATLWLKAVGLIEGVPGVGVFVAAPESSRSPKGRQEGRLSGLTR